MSISPLILAVALAAPPGPAPAVADTLVEVDGHRLHLEIHRGTAPLTIVFEAGGGAESGSWASVPDSVAARTDATVVAYDRAGLGDSDPGPAGLSPDDEIADLRRALERVGAPPRTLVVGHSYGGMLALLHAALHPSAVAGLVLVDPMNPRFVETTGDFVHSTVPDIPDPTTDREKALVRMIDGFDALVRVVGETEPELEVPIVVLTAGEPWWGSEEIDAAWRESHEAMAVGPARRHVVVEGSDHDVPGARPDAVIDRVVRMAEEISRPTERDRPSVPGAAQTGEHGPDRRSIGLEVELSLQRPLELEPRQQRDHDPADGIGIDVSAETPRVALGPDVVGHGLTDAPERVARRRPHLGVVERLGPQPQVEPHRDVGGVGAESGHHVGDHLGQTLGATAGLEGQQRVRPPRGGFLGQGLDQRLLALEIAVERAGAEPRLAGDLLHRGAVEPLPREAPVRGDEDLPPTGVEMLRGYAGGHASSSWLTN